MHDTPPAWRLERFAERFESWIERENPSTDLRILVQCDNFATLDLPL